MKSKAQKVFDQIVFSANRGSPRVCHIVGIGPSLKHYKRDGNFSIGCNDCFRYVETDYLVVVSNLDPKRAAVVNASRPKKLLTFLSRWATHPSHEHIGQLHPWKSHRANMMNQGIVHSSNNTPFICASLAYNMGYREIVLWGVDFTDHPYLRGEALNKTVVDFDQLQKEFVKNGASMFLGSPGSILSFDLWINS